MIPSIDVINTTIEDYVIPSRTDKIITEKDRVSGITDGINAVRQAIYLILNTERYQFPIYTWSYGVELVDLIGKPTSYVLPEIERRVSEALLQDDRISTVDNFEFEVNRSKVFCKFVVTCDYGRIEAVTEVNF